MNCFSDSRASDFRRDAGDGNNNRGNNLVDLLSQYDREKFQAMVKTNNAHVEVNVLPDLKLTSGSQPVFQPMHVVERGESLWSIARKELREAGLATSDRDVANEVKRIIEVNSQNYPSLKDNPNLIQKGWILELPSALQFDAARTKAHQNTSDYVINRVRPQESAVETQAAGGVGSHSNWAAFENLDRGNFSNEVSKHPATVARDQVGDEEFGKLSPYERDVIRYNRAKSTGKMFPGR